MKAKQKTIPTPGRASLLVVEDEKDLRDVLDYNLTRNGFAVRCVASGEEAIKAISKEPPALVVLDLMLPGMDGLEVCRTIKAEYGESIRIVMLTAKGEESDIVIGLELGADDYVTKPFSPRVLIARIKAILRRQGEHPDQSQEKVLSIGELVIDHDRHEVRVGNTPVSLTHTEFCLVALLANRPGRVFTRDQIVHGIRGDQVVVTDRSVDVHMVSLRRKLGMPAVIFKPCVVSGTG